MPQEREEIVIGRTDSVTMTAEERRSQLKAKVISVLDRGIVADRLKVDLPPELWGEWVSDSAVDIARMEAIGFRLDTEYAPKRALHNTGTKEGRIGDVVHMICSKELHDVIEEVRREQYNARHTRRGNVKRNNQEEELATAQLLDKQGLPPVMESSTVSASGGDIVDAVRAKVAEHQKEKATI